LEKRVGPCFARQVKRCAGACVGAESAETHHDRLVMALAPLAVPRWPYPGLAAIREKSLFGDRIDVHVLRDWCWLGTAHDEGELSRLIDAPPRPRSMPTLQASHPHARPRPPDVRLIRTRRSRRLTVARRVRRGPRDRGQPRRIRDAGIVRAVRVGMRSGTPVIRNCASRKCLPSIAMNGIVRPRPSP
jgi:DNA polymerase-3 subunit epsilon